jgi:hypothetical protein
MSILIRQERDRLLDLYYNQHKTIREIANNELYLEKDISQWVGGYRAARGSKKRLNISRNR